MARRWPSSPSFLPAEVSDLADDVRELFDELGRDARTPSSARSPASAIPPLDVFETDDAVEIVVDVVGRRRPRRSASLFRAGVVLIAGEKAPPRRAGAAATFHLVERDFGRFARAVRSTAPSTSARARATLRDGELTIVLPEARGAPRPRAPHPDRPPTRRVR